MIALGSDHGGFDLKERVKAYLDREGIPYQDYGCHSKESCDYPVFGKAAAEAVASGVCEKGIVICTTGIGISIAANKVRGIRCALCSDPLSADLSIADSPSAIFSSSFLSAVTLASARVSTGMNAAGER